MRTILSSEITQKVKEMCISANCIIDPAISNALCESLNKNQPEPAKNALSDIIKNAEIAKEKLVPICQDTGMAIFFVKIGKDVHIEGDNISVAIEKGVREGYKEGYLRKSIVNDPLIRENTTDNTPPVIHYDFDNSNKIEIVFAPKGFGSENKSALKMLNPSDGKEGIIDFVLETVSKAGANPCPPMIIGVGIGGNFEKSAELAKLALTRPIDIPNSNPFYADFEKELLEKVNELGIGVQGFGGVVTALGVNIETFPTHIAGLPVAVNISCHATRHEKIVI